MCINYKECRVSVTVPDLHLVQLLCLFPWRRNRFHGYLMEDSNNGPARTDNGNAIILKPIILCKKHHCYHTVHAQLRVRSKIIRC